MKALDLFGDMTETEPNRSDSSYQRFKIQNHYRDAEDKKVSCKTCNHSRRMNYHNKNYYKCLLIGISHSEATDIKLKMVCNKFTKTKTE